MKNMKQIVHYRYKSSEVSKYYKIAKNYNLPADKFLKETMKVNCYPSYTIDSSDIFPRGGVTVVTNTDLSDSTEAVCSFNDNYDKKRGVEICNGRLNKM